MSFDNQYHLANDCPNCGQQDSVNAWKGARMGSTRWGHGYMCCSEKCGVAFLNSENHKRLEREKIEWQMAGLKQRLEHLNDATN
jgi:Zn ribbon nucleic-acid-binding protein